MCECHDLIARLFHGQAGRLGDSNGRIIPGREAFFKGIIERHSFRVDLIDNGCGADRTIQPISKCEQFCLDSGPCLSTCIGDHDETNFLVLEHSLAISMRDDNGGREVPICDQLLKV